MEENTISYKLDRIKSSTDRIRNKTGVVSGVIEDVATAVEGMSVINNQNKDINANGIYNAEEGYTGLGTVNVNIQPNVAEKTVTENGEFIAQNENLDGYSKITVNVPTGSTPVKSNIYRVSTIEERDAITDMVEGDLCVVHHSNISNATVDSRFKSIIFPATVVLSEAITNEIYSSFRNDTRTIDVNVMLNQTSCSIDIMMEHNYTSIEYTSMDGITYTKTTDIEEVSFQEEIHCAYSEEWNDAVGYFIQVGSISFEGIFQYKNSVWSYAKIEIPTTSEYIYKDKKVYTNDGIVTGTITDAPSTGFDDMNAKIYAELSEKYNSMNYIVTPEEAGQYFVNNKLYTIPIKSDYTPLLDTSNTINMANMFQGCTNLITIPKLNTSKATNMSSMFQNCTNLTTIPLIDTNNVTDMATMFNNCKSLVSIPQLNTSNVTNMDSMFDGCYSLTTIPLLDTSKVTNMAGMFQNCTSLTTLPLLDTSNVTNMGGIFTNCNSLTAIPQLNTSKVTNMDTAFRSCLNLTTMPLLDTSSVTNMSYMLSNCPLLTTIPLLNTSNVTNMYYTFSGCPNLTDESLNNVLLMAKNSKFSRDKTTHTLGLNETQRQRVKSLPAYNDFIAAGWENLT